MNLDRREFIIASSLTVAALNSGCVGNLSKQDGSYFLEVNSIKTNDIVSGDVSSDGERLYVGSFNGRVFCYKINNSKDEVEWKSNFKDLENTSSIDKDLNDVEEEWSVKFDKGGVYSQIVIHEDYLYVPLGKKLACIDKNNGDVLWEKSIRGEAASVCTDDEGNVYVTGMNSYDDSVKNSANFHPDNFNPPGYVHKFSSEGEEIWGRVFLEGVITGRPVHHNGSLFFGTYDKSFYKLNDINGTTEWSVELDERICDITPAIHEEKDYVYVGAEDSKMYCFDISNGEKIWEFEGGDVFVASPVITEDDNLIAGSYDNNVYKLDCFTGEKKWETDTGDKIFISPTYKDGNIYTMGFNNGKISVIDSDDGKIKLKTDSLTVIGFCSPIAFNDKIVLSSGVSPEIHIIDTKNL